jgi:hypothetical protein
LNSMRFEVFKAAHIHCNFAEWHICTILHSSCFLCVSTNVLKNFVILRLWDWMIGRFEPRQGLGIFLFTTTSTLALGAHTASYTMGTRGSFLGGKVSRPWSWPLTSI